MAKASYVFDWSTTGGASSRFWLLLLVWLPLVASVGCAQHLRNNFRSCNMRLDEELESLDLEGYSTGPTEKPDKPLDDVLKNLETDSASEQIPPGKETPPGQDGEAQDSSGRDSNQPYPSLITLTLSEAQAAALEGNLDFRVAQFNPALATAQIYAEIGRFEATFLGTLNRTRNNPPPNAITGVPAVETTFDQFDPAIRLPFTTGGFLTLRDTGNHTSLPGLPLPNIYDLQPTLRFEQPLLRNSGVFVNTAQIQIAELQQGRVDATTKLTAINVVAQTEVAYWNLFGAKRNLDIANQQIGFAERQVKDSKRLLEAGVQTKVDLLRAESGLQLRRAAVVQAELQVLLATRTLKQLVQIPGIPVESPTRIELASLPNLTGLEFDRDLLATKAINNRLELIELALQAQQQAINLGVARNGVLPELNFVFDGKLLGTGTTPGQADRQAFGENYDQWFAGIGFALPLAGNQSARARVRQASLALSQTRVVQQRQQVTILKQINDAADQFENNWQQILVAQRSAEAARKTYEGEIRLFELGTRTSDLVLFAADALATAQLQLVQAIVSFQLSRVGIAVSTGTVLGYSGIQLTDDASDLPRPPQPPSLLPDPS